MGFRVNKNYWILGLALVGFSVSPASHAGSRGMASQGDSGVGVDTVMGNGLNPGGMDTNLAPDANGLGPFRAPVAHTPSGQMYAVPWLAPEEGKTMGGSIEVGALVTRGDNNAAKLIEYRDLEDSFIINNFNMWSEDAATHSYFNAFGGGVGRDDQYYGFAAGKYNEFRLRVFYNEIPHVFTTTAKSIFTGEGSRNLMLNPVLANQLAGLGDDNPAVQAVVRNFAAGQSEETLKLTRKKGGVRLDANLEDWSVYASYTIEKREGTRPTGATGGGTPAGGTVTAAGAASVGNGLPVQLIEPIDYTTHDLMIGASWSDKLTQFNIDFSASLFTDEMKQFNWQNPFNSSNPLQFLSTPADNQMFKLSMDYARRMPQLWNGRFTARAAVSTMRQNDDLTPYSVATYTAPVVGYEISPEVMAYWNSLVGPNGLPTLSQPTADERVDNGLLDLALSLQPSSDLSLNAGFRYNGNHNTKHYISCNPSAAAAIADGTAPKAPTGEVMEACGYPAEDGRFSDIGSATGNTAADLTVVGPKVRPLPYQQQNISLTLGGDYRISSALSVTGNYERENIHFAYRERDWTYEDKLKIGLVDRDLGSGTGRFSYEYDRRGGTDWKLNTYAAAFGYVGLPTNADGITNAEGQKFDLNDRNQHIFIARYNVALTETLDAMVTAKRKMMNYTQSSGRTKRDEDNLTLDLTYQPSVDTTFNVFYTYMDASQGQRSPAGAAAGGPTFPAENMTGTTLSAAGVAVTGPRPALPACTLVAGGCTNSVLNGGPNSIFFNSNIIYMDSKDTNQTFGFGLTQRADWVVLNVTYQFMQSRFGSNYNFLNRSSAAALSSAIAFPDMVWDRHQLNLSAVAPLTRDTSFKVMYLYDRATAKDWHYDGLSGVNNVPAERYYLDSGPTQGYTGHTIGAFLQYKM